MGIHIYRASFERHWPFVLSVNQVEKETLLPKVVGLQRLVSTKQPTSISLTAKCTGSVSLTPVLPGSYQCGVASKQTRLLF